MIRNFDPSLARPCREFLLEATGANYCHDPAWIDVIREGYGKEVLLWVRTDPTGTVRGMAPACFLASAGFGRSLVCLPYLDYGGILAEDEETEDLLRDKLLAEAQVRRANLEIRSLQPLCGLPPPKDEKVAMILQLREEQEDWSSANWGPTYAGTMFEGAEDEGSVLVAEDWSPHPNGIRSEAGKAAGKAAAEVYWKSLDAKVRNQVRKAEKSGVTVVWGREDRLDDFYSVFCVNMRDLGSPTHAREFFSAVLRHFPGAQIGTAYREGKCIGGLFRILWKGTMAIPWASTLKDERIHCPNNALYWESISYAFEQGCRQVDFGRSSRDQGTYKFKKQWLAQELPLYRYQFDEKGHFLEQATHIATGKLGWTRNVWAKMPLRLANSLGPMLRGSISA